MIHRLLCCMLCWMIICKVANADDLVVGGKKLVVPEEKFTVSGITAANPAVVSFEGDEMAVNGDFSGWVGAPLTSCNESANVLLSIKKMAELKGLTENEIADQIFLNYMRLF